jgi:dephospho-CoA kinase
MIIIGLTGSIGMGKTTASRMFAQMGCAIHNSDAAVHAALSSKGEAFEAVALSFPEAWDKKKHVIKRDVLAKIIFSDEAKRRTLENILHPIVQQDQKKFIQKQKRLLGRESNVVVLDIPLLFETGAQTRVDYTVTVSAPYAIQRRRVLARSNMTFEKFETILKTQMSDIEKCKKSDFIVPTGMGLAYSYREISKILKEIKGS